MKEALALNIEGVKCDVCDYRNDDVKLREYEEWLNKPCPQCGANLLTQEDFDNVQMLFSFSKMMNEILPKSKDNEPLATMDIKMDGTGNMEFKLIE
ncbi:hypothetical protein [Clostridium tagluense]|uniref:Uncharacterized protein n=1 Tax=Clostridium tagluense TaxID=360422 RepID=A0A401UQG7_9CLOT|nr:hypothetical protein [Clostridium tagluense]GCD11738.1 hypothetical protein Ctaglu_33610 [Clostridium tagluense]